MAGHEHHHHHHHHHHDHHHHVPEKLLGPEVEAQIREIFQKEMRHPVRLIFFTGDEDCMYCDLTRQLLEELSALEERLSLEVYHIKEDEAKAQEYHVERVPATLILAEDGGQTTDYGIRFYGLPAENEFAALLHTILAVSKREAALSEPTKKFLAQLKEPVRLDVFVTPSCPYCPNMVYLAHQMALASPLVRSNMVEAIEFPDWASAYGVSGVPHTVINEGKGEIVGMVPEGYLVEEIRRALAA